MCYALSKYISKNENHDVRVVLPYYTQIPEMYKSKFKLVGERTIELSWRQEYCGIYEFEKDGITYYFIDNKKIQRIINGLSLIVQTFSILFFAIARQVYLTAIVFDLLCVFHQL